MSERVRKFIEDNIDLIQNKQYRRLFLRWYVEYAVFDRVQDARCLSELFDVLSAVGIYESSTLVVREEIIKEKIKQTVCNKKRLGVKEVTSASILDMLRSTLLLDTKEVTLLFNEVCTSLGMTLTDPLNIVYSY